MVSSRTNQSLLFGNVNLGGASNIQDSVIVDNLDDTPKKYQVVYADPPWGYKCVSPTASKRPPTSQRAGGVRYYYNTMATTEISNLPFDAFTHKDSVVFLWATVPMLPDAFVVLEAWGFTYKTMLTWHKLRCKGMGYWFRGHTEHLLLGTKGKVRAFRSLIHNIQEVKVLPHSVKPTLFRDIIEKVTEGLQDKIELFGRERARGWDVWGGDQWKAADKMLDTASEANI